MNFSQTFDQKLKAWGISGKTLAASSHRTERNISQIRNGHVAPSITDFEDLIKICDELKPGFAKDYYNSLFPMDKSSFSPENLKNLDSSELASLMQALSERIRDFGRDPRLLAESVTVLGH